MKVTLRDKLGADLDKLRLQLPAQEEPKPLVGVVVPDPRPKPSADPLHVHLKREAKEPHDPELLQQIDEGQLVGEILDWLFAKGYFKDSVIRTSLIVAQREFFKERGR